MFSNCLVDGLLTSILKIFKHSKRRHSLLQGHLEYVMHNLNLQVQKWAFLLGFLCRKSALAWSRNGLFNFGLLFAPSKLFRNCLANWRFLGRLFQFLIVYKKKVYPILPHDSWLTSCKTNLVPILSIFATIGHKGHSRKILTAFLGTTSTFLKQISEISWCRI